MLQIQLVRSSSLPRDIQYPVMIPIFWQIQNRNGLKEGFRKKKNIFHLSIEAVAVKHIY